MKILFFGSTNDSVIILERISALSSFSIAAVVTQPAKPIGRDHVITPTPVETWAKQRHIAVLTFESNPEKPWLYVNEQQVIDTLQPVSADLLISASYGIKIPWSTIQAAKYGGINVHPSILPHWRGADPVPWAILRGDHQIGVSLITLSETFDQGVILSQEKIPIMPKDTSDPLRTKLFTIGADLLTTLLPNFIRGKYKPTSQLHLGGVKLEYARKFTREDGFEPWETLYKAITTGTDAERIERKFRALHPWPGVWTTLMNRSLLTVDRKPRTHDLTVGALRDFAIAESVYPRSDDRGIAVRGKLENKRLKLLSLHLSNGLLSIDEVQIEGKKPVSWKQFAQAYLPPLS